MRRFWHAAALVVIQLLFPLFAVAAAPVISSLTPNTGAVGSTVVIAGSNFGSTQANDTVTFNGTKATITSFSSTSIKATVPTGATTGNVVVTVSGVASNGVLFTVTSPPNISSLTPNTGAVGSSIVIAGSNFGPTQGTGKVTFNGTTATITTWSATQIVAKVPTGATTGNVVVTAAGGVASNGVTFTVTPAPSISSLVPNSGIIGAAVTINGSNFGPTQGNGKITFNGTAATVNTWSATQITTSVPTGATTGNVVVTAAGGVASNGVSFTVIPPPSISTISPTSGATGTSVTINGSNFGSTQGSSTVTFNGAAATATSWSTTKLVVTVPAAATTGNVVVTVSTQASNGVAFTVLPHIATLSPTSQPIGDAFAINGTGFGTTQSSSTVTVGGISATATSWSTTQVVVIVPSGAAIGSDAVVVKVGGNSSNSATLAVVAALSVTASATPKPNTNGWNNTSVTISYACSGGVQPVQCPASQTISTQGANQNITATAKDANGNTASASTILNIDETAPTITATVTPAANAKGVVTAPATINFTCSDSLSGVATCPSPIQVTTVGLNESFSGTATDKAGNSATTTLTVSVQSAPLAIVATAAPQANANGWNNTNVTVSYTCSGGVPPLQCPGSQTVTVEGANQVVNASVTDAATQSASASTTVSIDKTPPTITASVSPVPNAQGVVTAPATITFTCSDALSGVATCPAPIQVTTVGLNESFSGTATDKAGNSASASVKISVESAPLSITATAAPQPNANGWNNTNVTVSYTCSGGVPPLQCPGSQTVSAEGANQVISATVSDAAGQSASTTTTVSIDKTPPTITASVSPVANAQGVVTAPATITFTCSDALSGVATCPSSIPVTTVGLNESFSGTATDKAGNSASASVTISVQSSPLAIVATAAPQPNANGWNNTNVTVSYTCSGGVPPLQCPGSQTVSVEGANQVISASVTDAAGQSASSSTTVSIDKTPPTITASVSPVANAQGVVTAPATITFTCSDALSGVATCPSSIPITTVGLNESFSGTATDKAGNSASASVTISVQSSPLAIVATAAPQANANGWNNTAVTISYTCSGGVPPLQCPGSQTVSAEGANQIISATVTDAAGQSASASTTVSLDKTPPTITASVSPVANAQGVVTAPATITFTCSDALSGVATCPAPIQVTTVGLNEAFSGTATDKAGNSASASVTISVQSSPLAIVATAAPQPNTKGWNNTAVTISYACSGGVPPLQCPGSQTVSAEGANQVISATVTDAAGQSASTTTTLNIDRTPPTVTPIITPAPVNGWNNTNVTITFTCSDALSGVAICPAPVSVTTEGASQVVSFSATDVAGNTATGSLTLNIDKTPPIITATVAPAPNANGWNTTPVTVSFQCSDTLSGIAICPPAQTVSAQGANQNISGTATDIAGNTATATVVVNLETAPPSITATAAPAANAAGWNNTPVTVTFQCTPSASPVTSCPQPQTVSNEGTNQMVSGTVTDAAGLSGNTSITLNIDQTPPIISATVSPAPNASGIILGPNATVSFTCSDALSGIATCPSSITTTTQGSQTITGTAIDVAGNTANASIQFNLQNFPPLQIVASVSPAPNAAGWNNSPVTVAFQCSGGAPPVNCPGPQKLSTDGAGQVVTGTATDSAGSSVSDSATINLDQMPPLVSIASPSDGSISVSANVAISGLVNDGLSGLSAVLCNGTQAIIAGGTFNCSLQITQGSLAITVQATDVAGNTASTSVTANLQGPKLTIISPAPLALFNNKSINVTGTVDDLTVAVSVNGVQAVTNGGNFTAQGVILREGSNVVTATAKNAGGAAGTASVNVVLDTTPPIVTIDSPSDQAVLTNSQIYVTGMVNDVVPGTVNLAQATVTVNGVSADVTNRTFMAEDVQLVPGKNVITATATDRAGNTSQSSITVTLLDATAQQRILMVSGNGQSSPIGGILPQPLVVEVVNAVGQPLPNVPLTFNLIKGDGQLTAFPQQGRQITIQTDANGQASATLQLGTRVGSGNNQVLVSSPGFVGEVMFCSTATVGTPTQIHDIAGEMQKGVIGQALPEPFSVVVFDVGGNPVSGVPVVFTVEQGGGLLEGSPTVTKTTDSDGRASALLTLAQEEGINNNVVSAAFNGLVTTPVSFIASGVTPANPTTTTVSGIVLDNGNQPVVNVTASIEGTNLIALTDENGRFSIANAPVGSINLFIDGSTSTEAEPYPFLEFPLVTVAGQDNHLPSPIFLPELDADNSKVVGGDEDVTLTMKGVPGVQFTVFAHSATFPDGTHVGKLSVSQVHSDKVPMPPPNATAPHLFWTVQPPRVKFNPPMRIQIPNTEGVPPGTVTEIFCYNHDLEEFASGGTARVSADGSMIVSDRGSGVIVSGWGDAPPPSPPPSCADGCKSNNPCQKGQCVNNHCQFTNLPDRTKCTDDHNDCTDDVCIAGSCQHLPPQDPEACCSFTTSKGQSQKKKYNTQDQCCTPHGLAGKTQSIQAAGLHLADCPNHHGTPAGYTATSNGCGPGGALGSAVPNNPTAIESGGFCQGGSFVTACDAHDICYGTCNNAKGTCDNNFHTNMNNICNNVFANSPRCRNICLSAANTYFNAVSNHGQGAFDSAQEEACVCCP